MTIETRNTLGLDGIQAFELTCAECGTSISIPLDKCTKTTPKCPRCNQHWYLGGAAENEPIISLARAIEDIKSELMHKPKYSFRIRFTGCDDAASRDLLV